MTEKFITALEKIKNPTIRVKSDLTSWKATATNLITRIFGNDSKQEKQISQISFEDHIGFSNGSIYTSGNNGNECETRIEDLINSFITDITDFGLPEKLTKQFEEKGEINISVNQNQTVNVHIIWNSIKDQMTEHQQREIKEIVESKESEDVKKRKLVDKLKSFGADLGSNILASILTNPAIFGG